MTSPGTRDHDAGAAPGATVAEPELVEHVARALTPHKRPREVRFVDSLPRNALGKVQKHLLPALK